ncbi:YbaB/EbfC family nucleoid-associated protein [Methylobrevis pamukkalensis]|uniref:Nucleoid-associated protein A6302_02130 n=1 Tax=Methylobrevis pamukkalensis TaxID=1439726 RepID=A0A1E3H2G9_9HYPH|nr:YbaB/EbfC family nucleoid-associated protein [Methylobrevis pamukkalensis]ODN70528.1 Nucleoid-associated protein YbaB [Methylobrevis pamukkalensis]
MFGDLGKMMKQAQELQARMAEAQDDISRIEVTGASGAGLVSVRLAGKGELRAISIDPSLLNAEEAEILEDLVVAAHNDARIKLDAAIAEKMQQVTGGLSLPAGFKLPF